MRPLIVTVALALSAAATGQTSPAGATGTRCAQVMQLAQVEKLANAPLPADIQAAEAACQRIRTEMRGPEAAQAGNLMADIGATLDRLGLTEAGLFSRTEAAAAPLAGASRFYVLADLAKRAFDLGQVDKAQDYARELLQMAAQYKSDWNYGNAIYYGYFVLGRVALQQGNVKLAVQYLLDSASTPGSPQLNSFGPNMTLAKDLLEKGQSGPVLQFLAQVRTFWKMDNGRVGEWTDAIRSRGTPNFGPNLKY